MTAHLVYLDTNIFSRVTDLRISADTAEAYHQLADVPNLTLGTSAKTKQEMEGAPNEIRASVLVFLFGVFAKVPWTVAERSASLNSVGLNVCALNSSWVHPMRRALRGIFDADDADHILQATQAGCRYFLTLDEQIILSRVRDNRPLIESLCPALKFCSLVELIQELDPNA